jgi:hypothetical protein
MTAEEIYGRVESMALYGVADDDEMPRGRRPRAVTIRRLIINSQPTTNHNHASSNLYCVVMNASCVYDVYIVRPCECLGTL